MAADVHWEPEATTGFERGSGPWPLDRRFDRQPKVRWLALAQLARTGVHVVVSRLFGQYADRRETFAFAPPAADGEAQPYFDHSALGTGTASPTEGFWFDFVADAGDGFNAAYAVAEQLAQERAVVHGLDGTDEADVSFDLPRGRILVMGGDEVYPLPSARAEHDAYRDRLSGPYEAALQNLRDPSAPPASDGSEEPPVLHLYAIPGNHDWYDGLGAFVKQFCSGGWIGAWRVQQRRSYFAIKLPNDWWIWGIDLAFEGPMDEPQLRYFQQVAGQLSDDDRIVLCTGYPRWLAPDAGGSGSYAVIRGFLHQTLGAAQQWKVRLMLSGDSHFYARHSPPDVGHDSVKVVAGGGGAYLSGTQALECDVPVLETRGAVEPTEYSLASRWPEGNVARGTLSWSVLLRVWRHWSLSVLIAVLYLLLGGIARVAANGGFGLHRTIERVGSGSWSHAFERLVSGSVRSATFWIFVGVVWAGLAGLALALQRGERFAGLGWHWVWGFGHAFAHVAAALALTATGLVAAYRLDEGLGADSCCYYAIVLVGGYVAGTAIFALYLGVAQLAQRSVWALFPVLAHEGWKNFLRIETTADGVTVYALGLQRVPKRRTVRWDDDGRVQVSRATTDWRVIDHVTVPKGTKPA